MLMAFHEHRGIAPEPQLLEVLLEYIWTEAWEKVFNYSPQVTVMNSGTKCVQRSKSQLGEC